MEFGVSSLREKNINYMADKFFGDKDESLKTIFKMNQMLDENNDLETVVSDTIQKMKAINEKEAQLLEEEMKLTLDKDGNIIVVDS